MYGLEIQKLLVKKDLLTAPQDKIKLLQQAIAISDSNHDTEWSIDLRLEVMEEELDTPHDHISIEAISWIIGAYEQDPDVIDEDGFLWQYKWVTYSIIMNPNISAIQKEEILNDFSMRLQRNHYSLRSLYENYFEFYCYFLIKDKATEFKALRDAEAIDDMSNCNACELDTSVLYYLNFENFEKGKFEAADILSGKLSCNRIPIITLAWLAQKLTQLDRLDEAKEFYDKGMHHLFKDQFAPRNFEFVAMFAYYQVKINEEEAWAMIEKNYILTKPNDFLNYKIAVVMLGILKNTTTEKITSKLPEWLSCYRADNEYNKEELYAYYYDTAQAIANKFAARENNPDISLHLDKVLPEF